ncbi:MAG: toll/interleukin-1 receptor domain-containing protein [Gammaproteobacteria bacterium]|nr:toll/interleukin-1 receptor domain-containing protein [Gammaproteobacteria bacterium]
MPTCKIFISHSTKTEPNLRLLGELVDAIADRVIEHAGDRLSLRTVYDRADLVAGDAWYERISQWMAECHVAVILFSEAALFDSDWVRREAAVLTWRRELQKEFVLLPVLLGEVRAEALEQGIYGVMRVAANQCIVCDGDAGALADAIVTALTARLEDFAACQAFKAEHASFEPIEGHVCDALAGELTPRQLDTGAERMGGVPLNWPLDVARRDALRLSRELLKDPGRTLSRLGALAGELPALERDVSQRLFQHLRELLMSFWVPADTAARVHTARLGARVLVCNGRYLTEQTPDPELNGFTSHCLLSRAWPLARSWRKIVLARCDDLDSVHAEILSHFSACRRKRTLEDKLAYVRDCGLQIVIVLPAAVLPGQGGDHLLGELLRRYERALFLIDCGERLVQVEDDTLVSLDPPIDPHVEEAQYDAYDTISDVALRA